MNVPFNRDVRIFETVYNSSTMSLDGVVVSMNNLQESVQRYVSVKREKQILIYNTHLYRYSFITHTHLWTERECKKQILMFIKRKDILRYDKTSYNQRHIL